MSTLILTDHSERDHLLPLTHTRPMGELRIGLWTIREKWEHLGWSKVAYRTADYLREVYTNATDGDDLTYVNGGLLPTSALVDVIQNLGKGESLYNKGRWVASRSSAPLTSIPEEGKELEAEVKIIDRPWKIFQWNDWALRQDMEELRKQKKSQPVPQGVQVIGEDLFIDEGAEILPSIINTTTGPVYIGKDAVVMEGSMVRGPLALMDHAQLKMGTKIYGATTIGPHCKVGGEMNNCVIFGYSNKAHDGFIGNSVIGEWCNLGADTNTSNLKNNYADVKIYSYALGRSESTGGQFCGLTMGDHAKAGINTMFNTGTVCGAFANVFGGDFPHRQIPDFAWGGAAGFKNYRLADALTVAEIVMARRSVDLTPEMRSMYTYVHDHYAKQR